MADGGKVAATQLQPSNIEAEQALLGALLLNNEVFDRIDPIVKPHHFYEPVHGRIFEIASRRIQKNALASPVTLKPFLAEDEGLRELGGTDYLARLAGATISIVAARDFAETIRDLALRRDLVQIGEEIMARAATFETEVDPSEQITEAEQALYTLAERGNREGGFINFADAAAAAANVVNAAFQRGGGLAGISSGLHELDYKLGGFRNSDLIILAGRPSMGKTALATNIAFDIARKYRKGTRPDGTEGTIGGGVVGFFSLEMSSEQLANRILAAESRIKSHELLSGRLQEDEFRRFLEIARELEKTPLYIDDTPALPISSLAARARRLKRQHGLDVLVIDYLQLVRPASGRSNDGRVQEVTEITQGLKAIAKELDIPVIALAQLSRKVEDRDDKRPQLADLPRIGLDRTGRRRGDVRVPRGILPRPPETRRGQRQVPRMAAEGRAAARARRDHHRQAAPRPDRQRRPAFRGQVHQVLRSGARKLGLRPGLLVTLSGDLAIDLDAIAANWRALDALSAPAVETAAVVKADTYGCGAAQAGPALARAGARTFFVALPDEGAALRQILGPDPTIYILGGYAPLSPPRAAQSPPPAGGRVREGGRDSNNPTPNLYPTHSLRPVLNSAAQAAAWFRDHPDAPCAIQLDTGMNRLGMEAAEFASLGPLPASVQLVMSHLACGDEPGHPQNPAQLAEFRRLTEILRDIPRSFAGTGGILLGPGYHFDMTRPGIGLYGGLPFVAARAVVTLHLPIIQIREVAPGETVGYGATWAAQRPSRIATLSGGYSDGLIRAMGGGATGYLDGQPLPFAGRVSMDLIGLDVTGCPAAAPGAMVEILGPHQSVDDLAAAAGTIGHEILASLGSRYRRRYTGA